MKSSLKIIFMGTPSFAVPSLDALIKGGYEIAAVVTAPDRPAGRGLKLQESDIKKYAVSHGLTVLQPTNLKSPGFLEKLQQINPDLQVVVAFRMLPEVVWSMPAMGTLNLHASLLPQYRGAAPINWAVINGEKVTGVTTFKLQHQIDTGNILLQQKIKIGEDDTAGDVHDKLMVSGAALLLETVNKIRRGDLKEIPQKELLTTDEIKHAPKIFDNDCRINWGDKIENIYNLIRGLSPYPAAYTLLKDKRIKILTAEKEPSTHTQKPGTYVTDGKIFLKFAAIDGFINILKIKPEGKGTMSVADFLRGKRDL